MKGCCYYSSMRCVLVGNYGVGNVGDEALRDYFLSRFAWVQWDVLSAKPGAGEYARLPAGLRSLLGFRWLKTLSAYRRADAVVFGGGSLFTDVESPRACVIWWIHAVAARVFQKPIFLAFQGVGPVRSSVGKWCTKWVLRRAHFVSVRDAESGAKVAEFCLGTKYIQTADPIFIALQKLDSVRAKNVITVIPRHNSDEVFKLAFLSVLKKYNSHEVYCVLLQPNDPTEQATAERLRKLTDRGIILVPVQTLQELADTVAGSAVVLTQRYHGAIAALCAGVTVEIVAQGPGDKLWALREAVTRGEAAQEVVRLRERALEGERALEEALRALARL
jgi:polysaccharide pyruvyl transferase WcaK-like protein